MLKRALWIVVPVLALVAFWFWSQSRPLPVDMTVVTHGPIRAFVEEEGRTRVVDRFVVSSPVTGRLLRVEVEEGDHVECEQVVARLDPLPLGSAVEEVQARIRALRERMDGVDTKKPKAEEIARAKVLEEQARESLEAAGCELDRAKATWSRLEKDLERARDLAEKKLIPLSELDAAIAAECAAHEDVQAREVRVRIARLAISATSLNRTILDARLHDFDWEAKAYEQQIAALEASLATLQDDLERSEVRAPASGIVLRVLQESEQVVQAGTPILEIGDPTRLEVEVDFLSEDAAHMRDGMKAEIFGRALGEDVLEGRVERIYPSAFEKISSLGVEQQRVYVIVVFDGVPTGIKDRFRVEVRVILDERDDVTLVPEGALFRHQGDWFVFVVDAGAARLRRVTTGLRDGRVREVLEGLQPGERVVLHPGDTIGDGARVEPLPSSDTR